MAYNKLIDLYNQFDTLTEEQMNEFIALSYAQSMPIADNKVKTTPHAPGGPRFLEIEDDDIRRAVDLSLQVQADDSTIVDELAYALALSSIEMKAPKANTTNNALVVAEKRAVRHSDAKQHVPKHVHSDHKAVGSKVDTKKPHSRVTLVSALTPKDLHDTRVRVAEALDAVYVDDVDFPLMIFRDKSAFIAATWIVAPMTDVEIKDLTSKDYNTRRNRINSLLTKTSSEHNRCFFASIMFHNPQFKFSIDGEMLVSPWALSEKCRKLGLGPSFEVRKTMIDSDDLGASTAISGFGFCDTFGVHIEIAIYGVEEYMNTFVCFSSKGSRTTLLLAQKGLHYLHLLDSNRA